MLPLCMRDEGYGGMRDEGYGGMRDEGYGGMRDEGYGGRHWGAEQQQRCGM